MSYLLVIAVLVVIAGGIWFAVVRTQVADANRPDNGRADEDVTDTSVRPPPHPDKPIPGSDRYRGDGPESGRV